MLRRFIVIYIVGLLKIITISSSINFYALAKVSISIVTEHYPPLQIQGEDSLSGYTVDIVTELIDIADVHASWNVYPWARAYNFAKTKPNTLIFSIARNEHREQSFHWIESIGYKDPIKIWTSKGKFENMPSLVEELSIYNTAIPRKDSRIEGLKKLGFVPGKNLHLTLTIFDAFKMLERNHIDFVLAGTNTMNHYFRLKELDPAKFDSFPLSTQEMLPLYIAFSKKTDQKVLNKFAEAFNQIKNNGKLEKIKQKWGIVIEEE